MSEADVTGFVIEVYNPISSARASANNPRSIRARRVANC